MWLDGHQHIPAVIVAGPLCQHQVQGNRLSVETWTSCITASFDQLFADLKLDATCGFTDAGALSESKVPIACACVHSIYRPQHANREYQQPYWY